MKQVNQKRIVPVGVLAIALFFLLILFQVFVIAGGYELEASKVKKVAPWAYESFLKLVGEHSDTRPEWAAENTSESAANQPKVITIAGFSPESIPVTIEVDPLPESNEVFEVTAPLEEPKPVIPVTVPLTEPEVKPKDVVPVG